MLCRWHSECWIYIIISEVAANRPQMGTWLTIQNRTLLGYFVHCFCAKQRYYVYIKYTFMVTTHDITTQYNRIKFLLNTVLQKSFLKHGWTLPCLTWPPIWKLAIVSHAKSRAKCYTAHSESTGKQGKAHKSKVNVTKGPSYWSYNEFLAINEHSRLWLFKNKNISLANRVNLKKQTNHSLF